MNRETKQPQGTTVSLGDSTVPRRGREAAGSWLIPDIAPGRAPGQGAHLSTHSTWVPARSPSTALNSLSSWGSLGKNPGAKRMNSGDNPAHLGWSAETPGKKLAPGLGRSRQGHLVRPHVAPEGAPSPPHGDLSSLGCPELSQGFHRNWSFPSPFPDPACSWGIGRLPGFKS